MMKESHVWRSNQLCSTCQNVNFKSLIHPDEPFGKTQRTEWKVADIKSSVLCPFCRLLVQLFRQEQRPSLDMIESGTCFMYPEYFGSYRYAHNPSVEYPTYHLSVGLWSADGGESNPPLHQIYGLAYDDDDDNYDTKSPSLFQGRLMGRQIDIQMLKTWLSICTKEHCATCQPDVVPREVGLALKVIDVTRCCIIFAPSNCRYLALSYVWRDISQLELTEDTQHRLMEDNGLSTTEQQSRRVPKSIWDAIELTRQLGERYLWVDALCIKQDDEADKRLLINNMDVIYSSAIFTIVAAAGKDADAGLPGLHLDSSRPVLDAIENIQGLNLGIARRPFVDSITESTWEERGWTFQEKILSKRLMIFTDEQVFFHCNEATWFEDTILEKHDPDIQIQTPWYGHREWVKPRSNTSKFDKYGGLLDGYLHRDLTYESDILNAFQGILNALTPLFEGGFFWGLPTCLFDAALLWRTSHSLKSRRPNFPSWSWLGWKQYSIGYSELLHKSTASEIDWFQASSSCGDGDGIDQIIRIPNSESLRYETRRQGCSNSNTSPGEEELCTQWKKRHDSKKISTAENYIHTTIHPPPSHLLFFWTSSAILPVDHLNPKPTNSPNSTPHNHTYSILAPHPTTSTNIAKITLDPNWRETQPDTLEFIVISRDIRPNYLQRKENPPQQRQQRLNIMLIKYQTEGIASRVQLPQDSVLEAQWNELPNLKWKFVVLG